MLRRWMKQYADWDERVYHRLYASRRFILIVAVGFWACLAAILPILWVLAYHRGKSLSLWVPVSTAVAVILGVVVTRLALSQQRERLLKARSDAGLCLSCGYDLRAHDGDERCPECGTAVNATR